MKPSVMLVTMVMCLVQVVSSQNNGTMTQLDRMEEQIQIIQSTLYNMESEPCVRKEEGELYCFYLREGAIIFMTIYLFDSRITQILLVISSKK